MALHLNLHHEIDKVRALKRRDPLKISIYVLSGIAALFAIYYFIELGVTHGITQELGRVQAEFKRVEPLGKAAKKHEEELNAGIRKSQLLGLRIENRFYWAPVLEQIAQLVPREVQITRISGDVTGDTTRKCSMTIDGLSAGTDPRRIAEDLRTALSEKFSPNYRGVTSNFKTLEDGTEMVMLDGKQMPTATFAINLQLTSGEEPAPPPPPRKKK